MPSVSGLVGIGHLDTGSRGSSPSITELRGLTQLAIEAVLGVTDIVEDMHRNIASIAPIIGAEPTGRSRGLTGLVYESIRLVSRTVGFSLDTALAQLSSVLEIDVAWPGRESVLAALNGVLGDHLVASGNPLAIPMQLRRSGEPLQLDSRALAAQVGPAAGSKLLVLVHGLCMNDMQWERQGHDHGAAISRASGHTAVYLHYNSGRHISTNGQELSGLMQQLFQSWPMPITEIVICGHSMGGLVARSACHYAGTADHAWLRRLSKLVFLGTPHHGAPLERIGSWANALVGLSPYTAPFTRLGNIRSAGIRDLSEGCITDEEWDSGRARRLKRSMRLPAAVQCFAVAATIDSGSLLAGDGLVPVASALGENDDPALALALPEGQRAVMCGLSHFDLLSSREVCEKMKEWLVGS